MRALGYVPLPEFGGAVALRVVADTEAWGGPVGAPPGWLPDLSDSATLGCLLALVREAHGDVVWLHYDCGVWVVCGLPEDPGGSETEAEALVAALEAAP
jgi:hypothetical protein